MIVGVGTDIVAVGRLLRFYEQHGQGALNRLLSARERGEFDPGGQTGRFLAKRFAAKEAFGKALGTGLRAPATLLSLSVAHDGLGRPFFEYAPELAAHLAELGLRAHLSISDEKEYAIAFVVMEQQ
ncbi:MAG: holo-ACP synthase [Candidatus Accumulibacter sp.]|uniref:holo-ACP synthase n=1 Tax=Accumulibacter sp. TaxID=2053492 RepID=UPI0028787182|nr:holo-ACP synthase [Accumulibacter sp.]MDS4014084.1 holo-ACP synthase [Accumulibacter sp.]